MENEIGALADLEEDQDEEGGEEGEELEPCARWDNEGGLLGGT